MDVFDMLDTDGSGSVTIDEFIDGIIKIVCSERPVELLRIQKQLHAITDRLIVIEEQAADALDDLEHNRSAPERRESKTGQDATENARLTSVRNNSKGRASPKAPA